ncbi:hypothetical protein EV102420_11_00480 [Pseudescherichia vulneris NBRC 102420]|uniref:Morphogenetic protein n=1 Tax=Pseudescherichia vulneris NBRC 102420 TaxID=1115515 RepID=A0A090V342_PSEVU|nr:hypothetical protein [Pseudescherichia vulneris]GAL58478.1 hypothetical protein EV102420_11_00480 [Pseudescherichia vulneris NBRC 102420]STQ60558.1 putative morphogenetic protein [Pseudescherichia vulneris]
MKERGMIFNGEMVRAILDGRKTQTRRIIKDCSVGRDPISKFIQIGKKFIGCYPEDVPELIRECCPFGAVGDRIWVRETWADVNHDGCPAVAYRADGEVRDLHEDDGDEDDPRLEKYWFAAWYPDLISGTEGKWTPSIHMPRWASRITLEITDVRVERLNGISDENARAEGCAGGHDSIPDYHYSATPHEHFRHVWTSIYGEEGWSLAWVWVIEFKRVEAEAV